MAFNWIQQLPDNSGAKRISLIAWIFFGLQALLVILVIITVAQFSDDNITEKSPYYYDKMPEFTIKDLAEKVPILAKGDIEDIQRKVFRIVSENSSNIDAGKIEATIRDDSLRQQKFSENTKYLKMVIDIPDLKQTYDVIYSSNAILDPEVATFVLCPNKDEVSFDESFECNSSDNETVRDKIVPAYLKYFKYDYFSARIKAKDPNTIIIAPSVAYSKNEATNNSYINEVKESVYSLGFSPDSYKYYVRTANDVDYEHNK